MNLNRILFPLLLIFSSYLLNAQNSPIVELGVLTPIQSDHQIQLDSLGVYSYGFFKEVNQSTGLFSEQLQLTQAYNIKTDSIQKPNNYQFIVPISFYFNCNNTSYNGKWRNLVKNSYPELEPFFKPGKRPKPEAIFENRNFIRKAFNEKDLEQSGIIQILQIDKVSQKPLRAYGELYLESIQGTSYFKLTVFSIFEIALRRSDSYALSLYSSIPSNYYQDRRQAELNLSAMAKWGNSPYNLSIEYARRNQSLVYPTYWEDFTIAGSFRATNTLFTSEYQPELNDKILFFQILAEITQCKKGIDFIPPSWSWSYHPGFKLKKIEGEIIPQEGFLETEARIVKTGLYQNTSAGLVSLNPNTSAFEFLSNNKKLTNIKEDCYQDVPIQMISEAEGAILGASFEDTLSNGKQYPEPEKYYVCWKPNSVNKSITFDLEFHSNEIIVNSPEEYGIQSFELELIHPKSNGTFKTVDLNVSKFYIDSGLEMYMPAGTYKLSVKKFSSNSEKVCMKKLEFGWGEK